jgi:NAD(P)H-dependent FMN reductase
MSETIPKIALLYGSARTNGNAKGLGDWLSQLFTSVVETTTPPPATLEQVDPFSDPWPLGPVAMPTIPRLVTSAEDYPTPALQTWSRLVSSCSGFVILTPQFNHGYPGHLKNALDALANEWIGKPVLVVSYGGHGGGMAAAQLE